MKAGKNSSDISDNLKGVQFYKELMLAFSKSLDIDYVLIGKVYREKHNVQSIVYIRENNSFNALIYDLNHTPCEVVAKLGTSVYPKNVAKLFPKDELLVEMSVESYAGISCKIGEEFGLLVILSKSELINEKEVSDALYTFSKKVGLELDECGLELLDPRSYLD